MSHILELDPLSVDHPQLPWLELSTDPLKKVLAKATAAGEQLVSGVFTAQAATLAVTATGVSDAGVTLTLPGVPGQFHYISRLQISASAIVAIAGVNTRVVVTSTNLPGDPAWTLHAIRQVVGGTIDRETMDRVLVLRSAAAGVATTIVAPAEADTVWRLNAEYFTAS